MDTQNLIILKYQENFADNLSSYAYGKILENKTGRKCFYENNPQKRASFESLMSSFQLSCEYISTKKVEEITKKSYGLSRIQINEEHIQKEISNNNNKKKNSILNLKYFKIDDLEYISNNIKEKFEFEDKSFIQNYDILEKITSSQSIGLFINKKDIENNTVDYDYIYRATKRLNKYIRKPKLFIFSDKSIKNKLNSYIDFEIHSLSDWREEFYFLKNCKHKIILNTQNSYSECFWASILNQKDYSINIYDKKLKASKKHKNWIGI